MPLAADGRTRVLRDPITGELVAVSKEEAEAKFRDQGYDFATTEEIDAWNEREKFGTLGERVRGAAELAGETATLGLYAPDDEDAEARRKHLRRDAPGVAFAAEALGTIAPALAGGGLASGAARALGVSGRLATAASIIGEGGLSGYAVEQVQAREEGRDISPGNVFIYGIGGELLGRMVPKALGAGLSRAAAKAEDALAGSADNLLVRAERRAAQNGSDVAEQPIGPARDTFLRDNAEEIVDRSTEDAVGALDRASARFQDLGDISKKTRKIRDLVSPNHPAQDQFVIDQVDRLNIARDELEAYRSAPGLQGMVKKLDEALDRIEGDLTGSRQAADRFIATDQAKRSLQRFHVSLGRSRMNAQDQVFHDQVMSIVDNLQEAMRTGLERQDLWGRAARFQADINSAWHNRWFQGAQVTEGDLARMTGREFDAKPIIEYDPAKVRSFLQKDRIGRGLTQEKLHMVLDGMAEMAEAHRKWGISPQRDLDQLLTDIAVVRKAIGDADEVRDAIPRAKAIDDAEREAARDARAVERERIRDERDAARDLRMQQLAEDQLVATAVPVIGGAFVAARRALRNINVAGNAHIKSAANMVVNGTRRVAKGLKASGEVGAPIAATALGWPRDREPPDVRFQGQYPTLTQSFQAKREQLVTAMQEPDTLVDAIVASFGNLEEVAPHLQFGLTVRVTQGVKYLSDHMPPGVEYSLMSRHATPPDVQAIKQFARLWEAVMNPGAVIQDFANMQATPDQARAIEAVHPDLYANLQNEVLSALAESPQRPAYERLRYLNQIFKLGGALGGVWSPNVAKNIKNAMAAAPTPSPERLHQTRLEDIASPTNPRGIASIAAGPTSAPPT